MILRQKEGASMADGVTSKTRRPLSGLWRVVLAAGLLTLAAPSLGLERLQIAQSSSAAQGRPAALVAATRADLQSLGELTRLTFDLTGSLDPQAHVLADPDRVVVDLPEMDFQINAAQGLPPAIRRKPAKGAEPLGGVVASYRFGLVAAGKSRVVIHLASPARIVRPQAWEGGLDPWLGPTAPHVGRFSPRLWPPISPRCFPATLCSTPVQAIATTAAMCCQCFIPSVSN
jgi:N-acetylmuramoyl-L-alanine amidase